MTVIRRLVFAAVCAGLLAGLLATVMHQFGTVPIILRAEAFEQAGTATAAHDHAAHGHEGQGWEPREGLERISFTALADVLAAIAYGLLIAAGFALQGRGVTWRTGLWWGIAGFAVFTLAPGLGLPPELPGKQSAPLLDRQVWWVATAGLTGAGLALLRYGRHWAWPVLAVLLIVLPHVWGAPHVNEAAAPGGLAHQFVAAVTVVSFLTWAVLGSATAFFYRRFHAA